MNFLNSCLLIDEVISYDSFIISRFIVKYQIYDFGKLKMQKTPKGETKMQMIQIMNTIFRTEPDQSVGSFGLGIYRDIDLE